MYPFEFVFLYSLGKHPVVQSLGWMVVLFLTFGGASILCSKVAAPVCIPTNSADVVSIVYFCFYFPCLSLFLREISVYIIYNTSILLKLFPFFKVESHVSFLSVQSFCIQIMTILFSFQLCSDFFLTSVVDSSFLEQRYKMAR